MQLQKDFNPIVNQNEIIQFVEETLAIFINLQHKMESWSNFTKNTESIELGRPRNPTNVYAKCFCGKTKINYLSI